MSATLTPNRGNDIDDLWRKGTIGEVAEIIMGQAPPGTSYNVDRIGSPLIAGPNDLGHNFPVPTRWTTKPSILCRTGDIIISVRATIGELNRSDAEYCLGRGVAAIRPYNNLVLTDFLYFWLAANREYLKRRGTGSTFPQIRKQDIGGAPIVLPPLAEQQRIAEILRLADELRQLRGQANQRIQDLPTSLFYQMFGHQTSGTGRWRLKPLSEFGDVSYGLTVNQKRRSTLPTAPYLRVANVFRWAIDLNDVSEIGVFEGDYEKYALRNGDVLVVEGHGDPNQLGRAAFWSGELPICLHQNHLLRIRPRSNHATPQFLVGYINSESGRQYMVRHGNTSSGLNTINSRVLSEMPIPDVPYELQQEFTRRCQDMSEVIMLQSASAARVNGLLESLMVRAFAGNLTAAWRDAYHLELVEAARTRDELLKQTSPSLVLLQAEQAPLLLTRSKRTVHASLDKMTTALLVAAESRPAYFRPDDLVGDNGLDPVQAEAGLRLLSALGFVRQVQLDGHRLWRLVNAVNESVEKPAELAA